MAWRLQGAALVLSLGPGLVACTTQEARSPLPRLDIPAEGRFDVWIVNRSAERVELLADASMEPSGAANPAGGPSAQRHTGSVEACGSTYFTLYALDVWSIEIDGEVVARQGKLTFPAVGAPPGAPHQESSIVLPIEVQPDGSVRVEPPEPNPGGRGGEPVECS